MDPKGVWHKDTDREYALLEEVSQFKRRLGLLALKNGDLLLGLRHLLQGINFYRCWEFPLILSYFHLDHKVRLLDVGAHRSVFPWVMASRGSEVHVVDIDPQVAIQKRYDRYLRRDGDLEGRVHVTVQDATATSFRDEFFDLILNISAVEHFPGDGDTDFVKEANRILQPGGRLFLSFGIGEEYREWRWEWLFCRTYDEEALEKRIVEPSGLQVEAEFYFEDKKSRRFTNWWFRLPLVLRNGLLGWMQRPLYERLYLKDRAKKGDAHYLGLVLRKV